MTPALSPPPHVLVAVMQLATMTHTEQAGVHDADSCRNPRPPPDRPASNRPCRRPSGCFCHNSSEANNEGKGQ
jgi:hypothetical protein